MEFIGIQFIAVLRKLLDPIILVFNSGGANELGTFTGTAQFSRVPAPNPNFVQIIFPTRAPLTGFRPTATKSAAPSIVRLPNRNAGSVREHETAEVTGGTGRFAHATGHFDLTGQLDFTTSPPSFYAPWQGTIRLRGH